MRFFEERNNKGMPGGYAGLDAAGTVEASQVDNSFLYLHRHAGGAATYPYIMGRDASTSPTPSGLVSACIARVFGAGTWARLKWSCSAAYVNDTDVKLGVWDAAGTLLATTAKLVHPSGLRDDALDAPLAVAVGDILYLGIGVVGATAGSFKCISTFSSPMCDVPLPNLGNNPLLRFETGWAGGALPNLTKASQNAFMPWIELHAAS